MPPRKKAAASSSKKAATPAVTDAGSSTSTATAGTTSKRRSARGKKEADPEPEPEPEPEAEVKEEPEIKAEEAAVHSTADDVKVKPDLMKGEPEGEEAAPAASLVDEAMQPEGVKTSPTRGRGKAKGKGRAAAPITSDSGSKGKGKGRGNKNAEVVEVEEEAPQADPASEGLAPDIVGVVEEREDEDLAVDDAEPAPMDDEERRRLQERPDAARDVPDAMQVLPESGHIQDKMLRESSAARDTVMQEHAEMDEDESAADQPRASTSASASASAFGVTAGMSMQERMQKMNALRKRMTESSQANRREVVSAQNEHRRLAGESKRLERKRRQAELMGEKLDAAESGEDLERRRAWEYSLDDSERWAAKQERKAERADNGFKSYDDSAMRKYERDVEGLKPDMTSYGKQREDGVLDETERQLIAQNSAAGSQVVPGADLLYRDANSFVYADHKPSEDAIDRVINQINTDIDRRAKRSRVRVEEETDITYINERNKVFNKKLGRYYDKYTQGIRDNFERGTAL